jgi:hypothetical protein
VTEASKSKGMRRQTSDKARTDAINVLGALSTQRSLLSVYDDHQHLVGFLRPHAGGFVVFDADGRSLGTYFNLRATAAAKRKGAA